MIIFLQIIPNSFGKKSTDQTGKNKVPTDCYTDDNDGSISSDPTYVQNVWKSEFSNLYNPSTDVASNDAFLQRVKESVNFMENNMLDPLREHNPYLNRPIELCEVKNVIMKSKNGKSSDKEIPYEVLKYDCVI